MRTLKDCIERVKIILKPKTRFPLSLIALGNLIVYKLLSTDTISIRDKKVLYRFINELHEYTRDSGTDSNKYSKEFIDNTCDYKIARELVLRFKGHPFGVLSVWINHYYYDSQLWHEAIEQMIEIDQVQGLCSAIEYAKATPFESVEKLQKIYWKRLISHQLSFKDLETICVKSNIPLWLSKEACELVIAKNLLEGLPEKDYYLHFFNNVVLKAKNSDHYMSLIEKNHKKSVELVKKIN